MVQAIAIRTGREVFISGGIGLEFERYIRKRLEARKVLLMTHTVLGYPSLEDSYRIVETMVGEGVDLMELQIPSPEPTADGPVIVRANRAALERGVSVKECLDFAGQAATTFSIPFLVMTYSHIPLGYGVEAFVSEMAKRGLAGAIIPDLSLENGDGYFQAMESHGLSPILIVTPATSDDQMLRINSAARGFIYCAARKGVTGEKTVFSQGVTRYLSRCRERTHLPLAVGFGIRDREQVSFLRGKAEIAVIGTWLIRLLEERGLSGVREFIRGLSVEGCLA